MFLILFDKHSTLRARASIGGQPESISRHLRVLMISGIFYPKVDGSVIAVSNLLKSLHERGHNVELITRRFPETRATEKWMGIPITRVGPHKALLPHRILLSLNQVRVGLSLLKRNRADIIHAHGFSSLFAGLVLGRLHNIPVVAHFHGFQRLWHSKVRWKSGISLMLTYPIEKLLVNLADAIIAQSNALKTVLSQLYKANPSKIFVIPHVLDTKLFKYVPRRESNDLIILFVGSLLRVHGADLLIKAAPAVLKDFPQAKFMLIGKGPQRKYLKELVKSFHLENSVFLVGPIVKREELAGCYAESTVVVIPLYYEGYILSLVALEAMATGRPVVTTMKLDSELRESGVYSVSPDPDAIAQEIKEILLMSPKQYSEIGYSARRYVEKRCSAKVAVSTLSGVYGQLIRHSL